jgi:hypothetical protein
MYVLDGPAIVSVPLQVANPSDVFLGLTDLLDARELCFCNEVLDELDRIAKGEPALVWARSSAPNRAHKGSAYRYSVWVGHDFRELTDTTARDTQESAATYVVAQALELRDAGEDVTVVSEDRRPKPTRASLLQACEHFGLLCISVREFLVEVGLLDEDDDEYDDEEHDDA